MHAEKKEKSLWGSVWKDLKKPVFLKKELLSLFSFFKSQKIGHKLTLDIVKTTTFGTVRNIFVLVFSSTNIAC